LRTISRIEQEKKRLKQQQANKGYWQNELDSLGIAPDQKREINQHQQFENLSRIIKQAMFWEYKIAYSHKGDSHKGEVGSTAAVPCSDI
jgi:hypothetical protein